MKEIDKNTIVERLEIIKDEVDGLIEEIEREVEEQK